jgi:O-antigen ligase
VKSFRSGEFYRQALAFLIVALVFLFPIGMASVRHWTSNSFYLFVFFSLIGLVGSGQWWRGAQGRERWILLAFVGFVGTALLSLVNADDLTQGVRRMEKMVAFLLFVPIYLGVRRLRVNLLPPLLYGVLLAGPVMAGVGAYSVFILDKPRAMGSYHPIIFGDLAMLLALVGAATWVFWVARGKWLRILFPISIACALYASMLSGTRGAWLALPPAVAVLLFFFRYHFPCRRRLFSVAIAGAILLAISPIVFPDTIGHGLGRIVHSLESFEQGKNRNSSEGQRLLMWVLAMEVWRQNPLIGTGLGDFEHEVAVRMEAGQTELKTVRGHAHNIYFESLAVTGLLGLCSMVLAIFILPFCAFYAYRHEPGAEVAAIGGIIVLVSFAVFGLTEGWLTRSVLVRSYLVFLLVFLTALPPFRVCKDTDSGDCQDMVEKTSDD